MTAPLAPQSIGKYELEQYLGGGMSAVYLANDTLLNRKVVLKILKESNLDVDAAQRFLLEAQIAGKLNHENVIRTHDFGFDQAERPFMVLEYLHGEDLADAFKAGHVGSLEQRARIGMALVSALEYVHSSGVIHRDLKPANIFLADNGGPEPLVKLMDFGIARVENVSLTQPGMAIGTPSYMAPEQIRAEPVTKSVDIYAFGVLLWELFTGERAFAADTLDRIFYLVLSQPLNLDKLRSLGLPEDLITLIGECSSKESARRPADLRAIGEALSRVANPQSKATTSAAPQETPAPTTQIPQHENPPAKSRLPALTIAGALLLVTLATIAGVMFLKSPAPIPKQEPVANSKPQPVLEAAIQTPTGTMMLVPAGPFLFGKNKQSIDLPAFYIDKTEVSNRAYAKFLSESGASEPEGFDRDHPDLPVVNITFAEATAFAKWAQKDLPTAKQWEKAARGADGRTYPWGEDSGAGRANFLFGKPGGLMPVDAFTGGASPFHVLQMLGNVWEWVDDSVTPPIEKVQSVKAMLTPPPTINELWMQARGGSYLSVISPAMTNDFSSLPARIHLPTLGFRCVKAERGN